MAIEHIARLRKPDNMELPQVFTPVTRGETMRRHVLNRSMQEKSGRLYCGDDWDFDIPSLEIYAAR